MFRKLITILITLFVAVTFMTPLSFAGENKEDSSETLTSEESLIQEEASTTENNTSPQQAADNNVQQPSASGDALTGDNEENTDNESAFIDVAFTLYGHFDTEKWLNRQNVSIKKDTTIEDLLKLVFDTANIKYSFSESGELLSVIYSKEDVTEKLAKGDKGENSCWTFSVNGLHSDKNAREYILNNGDELVVFYSDDILRERYGDLEEENSATSMMVMDASSDVMSILATETELNDSYGNTKDQVISAAEQGNWEYDYEWNVIGLARAGNITETQIDKYYSNIENYLKNNGSATLNINQSSDNSKLVLALASIGKDPLNVAGYNLLQPLANYGFIMSQGVNGPIWALMAFDANSYEIPKLSGKGMQTTRKNLVEAILRTQNSDGGWTFSGNNSDIDMTGMALQALAPYYKDSNKLDADTYEEVKNAVDTALTFISSKQKNDGTFAIGGSDGDTNSSTSESSSQVITALSSLGIDPATDSRFIKNGKNSIDGLLTFYIKGGGFKHVYANWKLNGLATLQAYYALVSYYRFKDGKNALYDMTDALSDYKIDVNYNNDNPDVDTKQDPDKDKEQSSDGKATEGSKADTKTATGKIVTKRISLKAKGKLSEEAKGIIEEIKAVNGSNLPKNPANYDRDQINQINKVYSNYLALDVTERLAVTKDKSWKKFNKITSGLGRYYHYDEATGVDLRNNKEEILPWYVKLTVEEKSLNKKLADKITKILGEGGQIYKSFDIHLTDTLKHKEYKPDKILDLRIPQTGDEAKNPIIVHVSDKNKIEFLDSDIIDGQKPDGTAIKVMKVSATEFSTYAIAGGSNQTSALISSQDDNHNMMLWIVLATVAVLAIVALTFARRHLFGQEEKEDE